MDVDLRSLELDLKRTVEGEVRFDAASRALYASDFSIYRHVPLGVVVPRHAADVEACVAACREHGAPLLSRGCGTGPSGQTTNVAVVMDFSKAMDRIVEVDPERQRARVEPGVICDSLRDAAERHRLTYGPDPATHAYCTLGGMIGNNSCGTHSLMAGKTVDNVEELEVLTYDGLRLRVGPTSEQELEGLASAGGRRGEIYVGLRDLRERYGDLVRQRFPDIPRRVSGYNLDELLPENGFNVARALVGSEGTCVTVLEATLRLVPSPPHRVTVALGYPDVCVAADHVPEILGHDPIGLEGFDGVLTANMEEKGRLRAERRSLPDGDAWLLVEFGADSLEAAERQAQAAFRALRDDALDGAVLDGAGARAAWAVRESAVGDSRLPGRFEAEGAWEDASVHPDRLGAYLRDFDQLLADHDYLCTYYGHFGQGCVHTRITFDFKTEPGVRRFRSFMEKATDLVVSHGGSISGEYGEGQGRAELLPRMFGDELVRGFEEFKALWDPDGGMNPGKLVKPYRLDEDLRVGPDYRPLPVHTEFAFPDDGGSFAAATERCFGMARCRLGDGLTMCPSFQVTREEKHSTRGRANLLFEMLRGEAITDGWRSDEVADALDLCLACKGCKGDCPVQVDMATLKAEFLSHHYKRRLRPRPAYALGLVPWWARAASRAPGLATKLARTRAGRAAAGVHSKRPVPQLGPRPRWRGLSADAADVVLWPDTFTSFFHPEIGQAAIDVLGAAGLSVRVPDGAFCCGRPLYDYGMLTLARRLLRRALDTLEEDLERGLPLLVLEPSCAAVFRDELVGMLPDDPRAQRLQESTLTLAELLEQHARDWRPSPLGRRALVQAHCHQRAVIGIDDDLSLLERLGVALDGEPEIGCCGLAGSFGYERDHYELSMACAERSLLPRIRQTDSDTLTVANGFSCREQIAHGSGRRALHVAEVARMAL